MNKISNIPPKGTSDWFPGEYRIRKYIFNTWRKVCLQFGFEEYLTPIIELSDIYKAKSGEDVGGKELMSFTDRAGRELAIRPEMTPSVTRMVSRIYESSLKPLKLFSIANFFRNENPQKGRNREFWQLNCDIFGSNSILADVEVIQLSIEILKAFGADESKFVVYINDRALIESFITKYLGVEASSVTFATRILDKFNKIPYKELIERLKNEVKAKIENEEELIGFLGGEEKFVNKLKDFLKDEEGLKRIEELLMIIKSLGYSEYCMYNPAMVRGFDYYDGIIFEVYDRRDLKKDTNFRSLFGGGRYNGLAGIFGGRSFPSVGFAPGDETTKIFLEDNGLILEENLKSETYYVPIIEGRDVVRYFEIAEYLREKGMNVFLGYEQQKIGKALEYANKVGFDFTVLAGENEIAKQEILVKNMKTGEQSSIKLKE